MVLRKIAMLRKHMKTLDGTPKGSKPAKIYGCTRPYSERTYVCTRYIHTLDDTPKGYNLTKTYACLCSTIKGPHLSLKYIYIGIHQMVKI